jgi:hypothetical protein
MYRREQVMAKQLFYYHDDERNQYEFIEVAEEYSEPLDYLVAMAQHCDIDLAEAVSPAKIAVMEERCSTCGQHGICRAAVDGPDPAADVSFCKNLAALRAARPGSH